MVSMKSCVYRHRGREGKTECSLCVVECESCVMGVFSIDYSIVILELVL